MPKITLSLPATLEQIEKQISHIRFAQWPQPDITPDNAYLGYSRRYEIETVEQFVQNMGPLLTLKWLHDAYEAVENAITHCNDDFDELRTVPEAKWISPAANNELRAKALETLVAQKEELKELMQETSQIVQQQTGAN